MLTLRERKWGTLALCLVAIATVLFVASLFVPAFAEICEKNEYTGAKECPGYHIGPFLLLLVWRFIEHHGELFTALATLSIAAFTFQLKRSTDKLWEAGERQIRALRQSVLVGIHAAKAAKRQSDAARDSVELTKDQFRAVLTVTQATPVRVKEPQDWLIAVLKIENTGRVPAVNVHRYGAWRRARERLSDPFEGDEIFPVSASVPVGAPLEMRVVLEGRHISPTVKATLFVTGRLEYEDGFGRLERVSFTYQLLRDPIGKQWASKWSTPMRFG